MKRNVYSKFKQWFCEMSKEINEEIGLSRIKEFKKLTALQKIIETIKVIFMVIGCIVTIVGFVSSCMTVKQYLNDSSDILEIYQKGMNYLEDEHYKDAENCFQFAYKKNSDFLQLIYYYAYTEYMLENYDKSYKILEENKDKLNENETVFLAMYEYKNENYEKSQQYIDKIQQPEYLEAFAFSKFIEISTKLGFLSDYNEGLNIICNNSILLDAKLNASGMLPQKQKYFYPVNGFKIDEENLQETIERIKYNSRIDKDKYVRSRLYMYLLFMYYSIQYENYGVPTPYFADIAESLDYANHSDISRQLLYVLYLYVSEVKLYPEMPEQMKEAYKIVSEKYHELELLEIENSIKITEEDREMFEIFERISREIEDNTFESENYNFKWETDLGYNEDNVLKEWARTIENMVYYKWK